MDFLARILGYIFEGIYLFLDVVGIQNIGLCIILFTIVVRLLMLPSTIKQQKFTRLNSVMQPEIQAIQKKYKDKKDQASQLSMQEELRAVYDKYGTSPTGSCLQLIIQMAILFPLYRVIRDVAKYVPAVAALSKTELEKVNSFLVYNVDQSPAQYYAAHKGTAAALVIALIIPVLSGLFQFLSVQLSTKMNQAGMEGNPMAGSMKTMNIIMPLFSVYLCWSFSIGIGLYWMTGSLVMMLTQLIAAKRLEKIDVNQIIEENREKAEQKAQKRKEKQGIYREKVLQAAKVNGRTVSSDNTMTAAEKEEKIRKAKEAMAKKQGSLASKANLVNEYNQRNEKR